MTTSDELRAAVAIEVVQATKVIEGITVLDDVSFTAQPGRVTAFLGPNGAGKSTMLRAILGIAHLTSGRATIGGRALAEHSSPLRVAGAHLTPDAAHPRRTARGHLTVLAATNGLAAGAVADAIELVGLGDIAELPVGQMSLGMRQRLGLAAALIGDPAAVVLDEPHNGLDVGAIQWLRSLLRSLADAGRTVLVCSHLMGEVERVADDVVVLDQGRIAAQGTLADVLTSEAGRRRPSLEDRYLELVANP